MFKSLMSESSVKPHCDKRFLCILTLVRGEDQHKRRMEMWRKRPRHERHIRQKFMKKRKEAVIVIIFSPVFFHPFVQRAPRLYLWWCSSTAVWVHRFLSFLSNQLFRLRSQTSDRERLIFDTHTHTFWNMDAGSLHSEIYEKINCTYCRKVSASYVVWTFR